MYQYILVVSAAILIFLVLRFLPLKLKMSTVVYVSIISLLMVTLTKFLYALYSLPIAAGGFIVLLILFSYLLGRHLEAIRVDEESFRTDSEESKPSIHREQLPKNELKTDPSLGRLAQEKIDEIFQSASSEKEEDTLEQTIKEAGTEDVEDKVENEKVAIQVEEIEDIYEIEEQSDNEDIYFETKQRELLVEMDDEDEDEPDEDQLLLRRIAVDEDDSNDQLEENNFLDKRSELLEQLEEELFKEDKRK